MKLTVGSLFSGIGGLELGLERAGMKTLWQAESDSYARKVLAKNFPGVTCYEDVRDINASRPRVDVLCGGFPCQDISNAGLRAGLAGARSGLWGEFARVIRELRPRYVVVENVAALLARGLGRVLGDLAALGFDAEWDCIPAAAVGAPHRRDRLFLVAYAQRQHLWEQPKPECGGGHPAVFGHDGHERALANSDRKSRGTRGVGDADEGARGRHAHRGSERADVVANYDGTRQLQPQGCERVLWRRPGDCGGWASEPDVGRVVDGLSPRVDRRPGGRLFKRADRLRCLGNAVVPQVAEHIGRAIVEHAVTS